MKRTLSFLIASSLLLLGISCNNNPQPEEGKEYVKVEKAFYYLFLMQMTVQSLTIPKSRSHLSQTEYICTPMS